MIQSIILFRPFVSPATSFWGTVVVVIALGVGYIGFRLIKGFIVGYLKVNIRDNLKVTLLFVQGLGSLILALALPNNFLNQFAFFEGLYAESGLWIAVSVFILLLLFLILFGTLFSLMTQGRSKK